MPFALKMDLYTSMFQNVSMNVSLPRVRELAEMVQQEALRGARVRRHPPHHGRHHRHHGRHHRQQPLPNLQGMLLPRTPTSRF